MSDQPRDQAGRFATAECPRVYALLDTLTPPPPPGEGSEVFRPNYTAVPAPRCPHGHFMLWAAANCRRCLRAGSR